MDAKIASHRFGGMVIGGSARESDLIVLPDRVAPRVSPPSRRQGR